MDDSRNYSHYIELIIDVKEHEIACLGLLVTLNGFEHYCNTCLLINIYKF
jgi:hypothetical protein